MWDPVIQPNIFWGQASVRIKAAGWPAAASQVQQLPLQANKSLLPAHSVCPVFSVLYFSFRFISLSELGFII